MNLLEEVFSRQKPRQSDTALCFVAESLETGVALGKARWKGLFCPETSGIFQSQTNLECRVHMFVWNRAAFRWVFKE